MFSAGLVGLVGGAVVIIDPATHYARDIETTAAAGFVVAVGLFLLFGSSVLMARGPSTVFISSTGVDLGSHRRRHPLVSWSDPALHIVLEDFREYAQSIAPKYTMGRSGLVWVSPRIRVFRGFDLSQDAYDRTIEAARASGARVTTRVRLRRDGNPPIRFVDISVSSA